MILRSRCAAALGLVLVLGLASRRVEALPALVAEHAGDALWATAVVLALAFVCPRHSPIWLGVVGFGVAVGVEVSQLWQPALLESVRDNELGALVLGRGFLWIDLLRYGVGAVVGAVVLRGLSR